MGPLPQPHQLYIIRKTSYSVLYIYMSEDVSQTKLTRAALSIYSRTENAIFLYTNLGIQINNLIKIIFSQKCIRSVYYRIRYTHVYLRNFSHDYAFLKRLMLMTLNKNTNAAEYIKQNTEMKYIFFQN